MSSARFITIEGIDGAGKSTHLATMAARLRASGQELVQTREPGGTPLAEALRELVLGAREPADALTESLMVFAARRDHVRRVIRPALERGARVLCDRYADSSFAYQGGGSGAPWAALEQLEAWACEGLQPDLTLWFDLDPMEAARRRAAAREADRFEAEDLAFFERASEAFARRAREHATRFVRIDAGQGIEQVAAQVAAALQERGL
ncbi:dTMP kinase [Inhella sp.]|uniref:dTMP kinase n=1 Tax=Inhella sp. TaxID=1921806 RepID=UPI0035B406BA